MFSRSLNRNGHITATLTSCPGYSSLILSNPVTKGEMVRGTRGEGMKLRGGKERIKLITTKVSGAGVGYAAN